MKTKLILLVLLLTGTAFAQTPTQFTGLKACTVTSPYPSEVLTPAAAGDCNAYASPADPKPAVYDGTAGTIYTDPVFGTKIKRITPQPGMPAGNYVPRDAPQQIWNSDGSYMKLDNTIGGGDHLFQGTDPYTYIRLINVSNDGPDELVTIWSHTNRCYLVTTYQNTIRKVDVCNNDAITVIGTYATLTDTLGNVLNMTTPQTMYLKPKAYCSISQDDTKIGLIVQNGSLTYGFGVWSIDLVNNTSSLVWFHNLTSTGDLPETGSPLNRTPGAACISDDGNYLFTTWTINGQNISGLSRDGGGVVTLTAASTLDATMIAGATITVEATDASWAGQFTVVSRPDNTHLTYNQAGAAGSPASTTSYTVQKRFYGTSVFSATGSGAFVAQLGRTATHVDNVQLSDGTVALLGRWNDYNSSDYQAREAMRYSSMLGAPFSNCWPAVHTLPCGISGMTVGWIPRAYEQAGQQWHVSGQGSLGTSGLKGYSLESAYYEGASVDCSPDQLLCAEVFAEELSTSKIYRIAHHQAEKGTAYYGEPHATANRNFTKVVWGSSWRLNASSNPIDTYLVELGAAPNADTGTFTAPAGPYPKTVSGASVTVSATVVPGQGTATTQFWYTNASHPIGTAQAGNSPSVTLDTTGLPNATYTLGCDITDSGGGSGNCTTITITVNNVVNATIPTISVPNSQITGNVTATGTCTPGQGTANTWQALLGGANFGAAQAGAGPYSVTATSNTLGCLDGLCTFTATCGDTGGGTGTSAPQVRTVKNGITPTGVMR